jgi:hypothetical protein
MELFDNLASLGLTPKVLQIIIISVVVIFFVGMFWKFILIGSAVAFCVFALTLPSTAKDKPKQEQVIEEKQEQIMTDEQMYMEDCLKLTDYTKAQCKALWNDREAESKKMVWREDFTTKTLKVRNGT